MKKEVQIPIEILYKDYLELNSSYKVALKYGISATAVKRLLKKAGVLRTQNEAARIRNSLNPIYGKYTRTEEHCKKLQQYSKERVGEKNPFFGKKHTEETKKKIGEFSKMRTGERNPNYKDGKSFRRPRDYKYRDLEKLRNYIFNRDNFKCHYCNEKKEHLHAHHKIPFWVEPNAFLDPENLITVCTECHFQYAHLNNWHHFDKSLITTELEIRYSLNSERLNVLAQYKYNTEMRKSELDV